MDAQYVIDVASNMPEGDHTISQLDKITSGLMGAGKNAEHFQQAVAQVSKALDAAKQATAAANAELAAGQNEFALLERAAIQSAKAAEKAGKKNQGVVPFELAAEAAKAAQAVEIFAHDLKSLEENAKHAAAEENRLATSLGRVKQLGAHVDKSLAANSERLEKLRGSLSSVGGPLGDLGSRVLAPVQGFSKLTQSIGSARAAMVLGAVGAVAFAAAIAVVTVAAIAGAFAVANWAVGLADSARSAGLAREAIDAANPAFAALGNHVNRITDDTGIAAKELLTLSKSLKGAKVSADDMPDALRAAALAEKALGAGGSSEFIERIKEGKLSVKDFAAESQRSFGGIVAKQMRGLDAQSERFKKNIGSLFGGLDIEPVLAGLERLVGLFDKNTTAGATIKFLFESVFQPLINQAEKASYVIEAFAIGFLIGLTKVYIAVKPAIRAVKEFLGFEDTGLTDALDLAKKAGELIVPAFLVVVGIFTAFTVAVGAAIAVVVGIQLAIYAMIAAVVAAGVAIVGGIISAFQAVYEFLGGIDLVQIGTDIMMGLVNGISNTAGAIKDAVTNAIGGAITSAKSLLGIASPSKLMAGYGEDTGEGYAQGVEKTEARTQGAMEDMVTPPASLTSLDHLAPTAAAIAPGASQGAAALPGGAAGGAGLTIGSLVFNGVKDAEHALQMFSEWYLKMLEGDAAALGSAEAPA